MIRYVFNDVVITCPRLRWGPNFGCASHPQRDWSRIACCVSIGLLTRFAAYLSSGRGLTVANDCATQLIDCHTNAELAAWLGISVKKLFYLAYSMPDGRYITLRIPKKSGGLRIIHAPKGDLKLVQRKIARALAHEYVSLPCVHGFTNGRSVATNASEHTKKKFILALDLRDFFPSISAGRIHNLFTKYFGFSDKVANTLTELVCYEQSLPQGAPTSSILSNIVCFKMDRAFLSFASRIHVTYTRYADDLTFSTTSSIAASRLCDMTMDGAGKINPEIVSIIKSNYFNINDEKTHMVWRGSRQLVNGIVVNEKCNFQRSVYRSLRALFNIWQHEDYIAALNAYVENSPIYRNRLLTDGEPCSEEVFARHIRGRLEYYSMVITVDGKTSSPLEKLWTMFHDITKQPVPFVTPNRYGLKMEACIDVPSESNDDGCVVYCGTAFKVDHYVITCCHCLPPCNTEDDAVVEVSDGCCDRGNISVSRFTRLEIFDFAFAPLGEEDDSCITDAPCINRVNLGYSLQLGEPILAVGFPGVNKKPYVVMGNVTGMGSGGLTFLIDRPLIQGMSGGPVFNSRRELIGIIQKGSSEHSYERNGEFIPIKSLAKLEPFNTLGT